MPEMRVVRAGAQTGAFDQQRRYRSDFVRQFVDVWRFCVIVAVASQLRSIVLAGDPENVRTIGGEYRLGREVARQGKATRLRGIEAW